MGEEKKNYKTSFVPGARALNNNNYMRVSRSENMVCIWFDRYSGSRKKIFKTWHSDHSDL